MWEFKMLRKFVPICLIGGVCLLSKMGFADDVGYIKHYLINKTPYECYISVHQQFSYPIDTCLGPFAANETKICDGAFELHRPNFLFDAICNGQQHLELNKTVFLKNTYKSQNMQVVWTIDIVKKALHIKYKEQAL